MIGCIVVNFENCGGCRICELSCSLHHEKVCNPELSRIRIIRSHEEEIDVAVVCEQCGKCAQVCPQNAIKRNSGTGAYEVHNDLCTGCGFCVNVCAIGGVFLPVDGGPAKKCDICGGKPRCLEMCPRGAITIGYPKHLAEMASLFAARARNRTAQKVTNHIREKWFLKK